MYNIIMYKDEFFSRQQQKYLLAFDLVNCYLTNNAILLITLRSTLKPHRNISTCSMEFILEFFLNINLGN